MGSVLGLIAVHGKAGLAEFDQFALTDDCVQAFGEIVEMVFEPEIDATYPERWNSQVNVETKDGKQYQAHIENSKVKPGNPPSEKEIVDKALSLSQYGGQDNPKAVEKWVSQIWSLEDQPEFSGIFSRKM